MTDKEKLKIYEQIFWDYNINVSEVERVLQGKQERTGHFNKERIFQRILESYSWFTVIQIFSPSEIRDLLTDQLISRLRSVSLRKKYEFVQKRLQEIIPVSG